MKAFRFSEWLKAVEFKTCRFLNRDRERWWLIMPNLYRVVLMRYTFSVIATLCILWAAGVQAANDVTGDIDGVPALSNSYHGSQIFSFLYSAMPVEDRLSDNFEENRQPWACSPAIVEQGKPVHISSLKQWMAEAKMETRPAPDINAEPDPVKTEKSKRWSFFLPLMAEEVEKRGIELPLPFGISFNTVLLRRDVEVKEVAATINGPPRDLSNFISIDTNNSVSSTALRLDVWLLPFLNLYALGGYVQNEPDVVVNFSLPPLIPGNPPIEYSLNTSGEMDGTVFGGGITLAGGYKDFFLSLDTNMTFADLGGNFDEKIDVILYSIRTGWRGQVGNAMMNLYIGGMYWDAEREISGSVSMSSGDTLFFKVLQEPVEPFNWNLGMNVEISQQLQLVVEYGTNFADMDMLTLSFAYRF